MPMGLPPADSNPDADLWSLPVFDAKPWMRVNETRLAREGYVYGPPLLGNTSYFPTGVLWDAMVARHKAEWFRDVEYTTKNVYPEWENAAAALQKVRSPAQQSIKLPRLIHLGWRIERFVELQSPLRRPMALDPPRWSCTGVPDKLDPRRAVFNVAALFESLCGATCASAGWLSAIPPSRRDRWAAGRW